MAQTRDSARHAGDASQPQYRPGTPENPLHVIATVPNLITACRLVLTIAFLFAYQHPDLGPMACALFILAASTDWLDGQVARRTHQVSVFGKRFDPVMDRVLIFSGVLALLGAGLVPWWVVAFLVARDVYLGIGGAILHKTAGIFIDVVFVGKTCTFVLMSGFAAVLLGLFPVGGAGIVESPLLPGWGAQGVSLGMWAIYAGVALSLATAVVYTVRGVRALRLHLLSRREAAHDRRGDEA